MEPSTVSELQAKLATAIDALQKCEGRAVAGQLALELMHEVKNPLEALGNLTYLTLQGAGEVTKVREYMQLAEEQMAILTQIVGQTLGFVRSPSSANPMNLVHVAEAAVRIHQRAIKAKRINLVKDFTGEIMADVHGGEILEVVSNLIVNALDALPQEGTLVLRFRHRRNHIHIVIADNGHGVPAEHAERIFEPFFTTKEGRGTGLGLSLSKKIIERPCGRLRMRSSVRPGKSGTVFKITLPKRHRSAVFPRQSRLAS